MPGNLSAIYKANINVGMNYKVLMVFMHVVLDKWMNAPMIFLEDKFYQ